MEAVAAAAAGSGDGNGSNGNGSGRGNWKDFECNICLDMAADPVVTACGHLFCWACLYQWLHLHSRSHECPVCKGLVPDSNIIPIYGRGHTSLQIQVQAQAEPELEEPEMATEAERGLRIPKRPPAHRIQRFSDATAQNHRREDDVLARLRTLRDVLENGGHGHHSRPRVSALEHNSSGNNGGNNSTGSGTRRVRQRLGFDPDEILRHRMRYLSSDAPEEGSPAAAAATPVFRSSVSAALSTRVRARARARARALLRSRAGGGSSSSSSSNSNNSSRAISAFDDEDEDEDEDMFFERISASAAARGDPASASIFAPPSPPRPQVQVQAQAQGPSQTLGAAFEASGDGPPSAAIAASLFPRDNDEIARHLLLLRRGRESASLSASAEANVVVPTFAAEEDELIRRISLRQRRYLGFVRPILVDEVEERMARRLEHTLAREQDEIFRYLALIRRMRNSRLAAIRARLASMSGMHEISAVSDRARADHAAAAAAASLRSENPAEMDLIGAVENAFAPDAVAEDLATAVWWFLFFVTERAPRIFLRGTGSCR